MSIPFVSQLVMVAILVGFSAFFSAAETALFSLSKAQLQRLRQSRPARGEIVIFLLDHPRRVLSTILLGNSIVNTAACILALGLFHHRLGSTILVMIPVLLVAGEIFPKTFAIQNAENTINLAARPIYWMTLLSSPIRSVLEMLGYWMVPRLTPDTFKLKPRITQDDFRTLIEIGREQGVLQESERKMINSIMQLGNKKVRDVMTPRVDMVCIDDNWAHDEISAFLKTVKHRRVPIFDETPDTIVGILDVKKFLMNPGKDLTEIMDVPAFVPDQMNAAKLLKNFQQQKRQLAIVVDEFGGTEGVVTVEDIVEKIVGEVADEYDARELHIEAIGTNRFAVNGRMRLNHLNEQLHLQLASAGVETIGGFLSARLGHVPKTGEQLQLDDLTLTARRVLKNRVREVLIERKESA